MFSYPGMPSKAPYLAAEQTLHPAPKGHLSDGLQQKTQNLEDVGCGGLHKESCSVSRRGGSCLNPSTWGIEAGGWLGSRPAWSTEWIPVQTGLHRETLNQNKMERVLGLERCLSSYEHSPLFLRTRVRFPAPKSDSSKQGHSSSGWPPQAPALTCTLPTCRHTQASNLR